MSIIKKIVLSLSLLVVPMSLQAISCTNVGFAVAGALTSVGYQKFSAYYYPSKKEKDNRFRHGQRYSGTPYTWVDNKTSKDYLFTFDCQLTNELGDYFGDEMATLITEQIHTPKKSIQSFEGGESHRCPFQRLKVVFDNVESGTQVSFYMESDNTQAKSFPEAGIKIIPRWNKKDGKSGWYFTILELTDSEKNTFMETNHHFHDNYNNDPEVEMESE